MIVLGILAALVVGLSLGLLGAGGSILTVPIFVYLLGFTAEEAIAMGLAVVGITSLVGALGHWRAGNMNLRVALIFGVVAMVGTFLGARLAIFVSGPVQLILFALTMFVAAFFMLRDRQPVMATPAPAHGVAFAAMPLGHIVVEGLAIGVLTGLVGVGGGFLVVPALVVLGKVPMKSAIGTSLLVIAMKSSTGFLGYLDQVEIDWGMLVIFSAVAVAGILPGTYLVRFASPRLLRRSFALLLLGIGAFILFQNRAVVFPA